MTTRAPIAAPAPIVTNGPIETSAPSVASANAIAQDTSAQRLLGLTPRTLLQWLAEISA